MQKMCRAKYDTEVGKHNVEQYTFPVFDILGILKTPKTVAKVMILSL